MHDKIYLDKKTSTEQRSRWSGIDNQDSLAGLFQEGPFWGGPDGGETRRPGCLARRTEGWRVYPTARSEEGSERSADFYLRPLLAPPRLRALSQPSRWRGAPGSILKGTCLCFRRSLTIELASRTDWRPPSSVLPLPLKKVLKSARALLQCSNRWL